jgi:competence protein ComGC
MDKKFLKSESAVSEVVGFILVFSIIMLAISVIYAVGYPSIQSSKENTQFQNMEQSFMVLQSDIKMVAFDQAPVKTMKTSLGGGSLTVNSNKGHIKVESTVAGTIWYDGTIGAIEYEKNGRSIAYEGGGVWEKYPVGSAIKLSEPRIFAHNTSDGIRTVFVSIINISSDLSSVGGEGAASVVVRLNRSHTPDITYSPDNVIITVTSDYADAWKRYFDEIKKAGDVVNIAGDTVTATISYDTLVVNAHVIEVSVS